MQINNKKVLTPLLGRFEILRNQPFSQRREFQIDDLFAEFNRARLAPGSKNFKDDTHRGLRLRQFTYKSDDEKCDLLIEVKLVKVKDATSGHELRKTEFTATIKFSKRKRKKVL